ncbi:hypothetical protein QVD17_20529 [Tagetes erecta]|uniref:Transposase (putative) gypsy type domain-containing protein n=1 Tax=Tagetes erecta TaxID=13708 RepID=A0AAD8KPB7_TARER|nr:hypothetical protein QVD17_20529 [Tagetes erecta]
MRKYMSLYHSNVDDHFLKQFCLKYSITPKYKPTLPQPDQLITDCPHGYIALYTKHFDFSNLRIPFSFFFLSFLKAYRLNISQLSPLGSIRVTHFEIMCRALGGEPSLPLFRQFFRLARYGDWYTVEKRKTDSPSCVSLVPSVLNHWKDYFFWVSADVIPFKMHWRECHDPLNVIDPRSERFDEKLYGLLVEHQMPLQPFPEHVLIMTGLSRNWPYENAEPIIKDGDDVAKIDDAARYGAPHREVHKPEIELVKYLEKGPGAVNVEFTSRFLAEHEVNILDRTRGICYQVPGDVEIPAKRMTSDSLEPVRMLDMLLGSENSLEPFVVPGKDDEPKVSKENVSRTVYEGQKRHWLDESASSSKKHKFLKGKNIVFSSEISQASKENDEEQPDTCVLSSHDTTSRCNVIVETRKRSVRRARKNIVFSNLIGLSNEVDQKSVHVLDRVGHLAQLVKSVPELVSMYERKSKSETHLREQISRYRLRMTFQDTRIAKLVKKVRNLNKSNLVKNTKIYKHAKVVEALKKELDEACDKHEVMQARHMVECLDLKEKLAKVNGELELERELAAREKDNWSKERVQLEKSMERVSFERQWLIKEGFGYVINRLHRSEEFLGPLGAVQSKLWSSAAHDGVVAGYARCKAGVALEKVELYNPDAEKEFKKAVYELEHVKYPYVEALSQCTDRTLDELKALEPMGMEDEEE